MSTVVSAVPVADSRAAGPPRAVLLVLCACVMVAQSMVAAINLAIPLLATSPLHPSSSELLWAVDAYVIVFAALLIPAGALGDRYGRKGALLAGLGLFAAGALTSALAPHAAVLIAGRAVSGAGAALIMPATLSIVVQLCPDARTRASSLAAWTLSLGLGGALGNIGGGLLQQYLPWQALFWVMVPAGLVLLAVAAVVTPKTPRREADQDPLGATLLMAGSTAVLYGIIEGPAHGWGAAEVLAGFGLGAVLLAVLVRHSLRSPHPLIDPRVFRSRRLSVAVLGTGTTFFGLFALFFVNSQYLQYVKDFSAGAAGLAIVPLTLGMILVPRYAVRLEARLGPLIPAAGGLAVIGAGLLAVATADAGTPYPLYAVYLVVLSVGMGFAAPVLTHGVMANLPVDRAGMGAGLNSAAREFGAAGGVAVIGTVMASHAGDGAHPVAFADSMGLGLGVIGVLVLLAAGVVALGYRRG